MKEQKVTVLAATQANDNGSTRTVYREVKGALAVGFLAVHPITEELSTSNAGMFRITHTPTGYAVGKYDEKDTAIQVRNALAKSEVDWEFTDPASINREVVRSVKDISNGVLMDLAEEKAENDKGGIADDEPYPEPLPEETEEEIIQDDVAEAEGIEANAEDFDFDDEEDDELDDILADLDELDV